MPRTAEAEVILQCMWFNGFFPDHGNMAAAAEVEMVRSILTEMVDETAEFSTFHVRDQTETR